MGTESTQFSPTLTFPFSEFFLLKTHIFPSSKNLAHWDHLCTTQVDLKLGREVQLRGKFSDPNTNQTLPLLKLFFFCFLYDAIVYFPQISQNSKERWVNLLWQLSLNRGIWGKVQKNRTIGMRLSLLEPQPWCW